MFEVTAGISLRGELYSDPLETATEISFRAEREDIGAGSCNVALDDPRIGDCVVGNWVHILVDGLTRETFEITQINEIDVADANGSSRVVKLSGPGPAIDFQRTIVYPENGVGKRPRSTERKFDFSSAWLDDSSWTPSVYPTLTIGSAVVDVWGRYGPPVGWPDPLAGWIWSRFENVAFHEMPVGVCYFRRHFTLDEDKILAIYVSADDGFELYLDNVLLLTGEPDPGASWENTYRRLIKCSSGDHILAVRAENYERGWTDNMFNIAGLAVTVFGLNSTAEDLGVGNFLFHTGLMPGSPDPVPDGFICLDYPTTPPGFTIGRMLNILRYEANAYGYPFKDWFFSFTDDEDSAGNPWDETNLTPTLQVGSTVLDFLRQMEDYAVWRVNGPTRTLDVFQISSGFPSSSAVFAPEYVTGGNIENAEFSQEI